tara:strand:- start:72 stop:428 length:357 start_codon:yes stop_codon:yes gene_type:complete
MTWREDAKGLSIALYDHDARCVRKKVDVLKDIEATKEECKDIKIVVRPEDATEICRIALFEHVFALGMKNITCEKWFINCKRKGIVFKGQKNDENKQRSTESGEGSGASEHVSEGEGK